MKWSSVLLLCYQVVILSYVLLMGELSVDLRIVGTRVNVTVLIEIRL